MFRTERDSRENDLEADCTADLPDGELLSRHRSRLLRAVSLRMDDRLKARFDPSDVVQETMIRAARKLPEYLEERPIPLYPWLRNIALERLIDLQRFHLGTAGRSVVRELRWHLDDASTAALSQLVAGEEPSPSGVAIRRETCLRVQRALTALAEGDRDLLLMRYIEQMSVADIAAVLELTPAAVKSRLRRSLERLHGAFGGTVEEIRS